VCSPEIHFRAMAGILKGMSDEQIIPTPAVEAELPASDEPTTPPRALTWLPMWELVALFIGDFITLILFGVWGQISHGMMHNATSPIRGVINDAAPFMLAWLIVAVVTGTYQAKALYPLIWKTLLAGVIAGPLGGLMWALSRGHWPAPIFYAITTAITTAMLLVWRVFWSRLRRQWWPELP
jgi:hypothetical protein